MKINVSDIDPRSFCIDDIFMRVMKKYQKEQLGEHDDDDWEDD